MRESVQQIESQREALDLDNMKILDELGVIKDREEDAWKVLEGYPTQSSKSTITIFKKYNNTFKNCLILT